jgi:hypothetical protein
MRLRRRIERLERDAPLTRAALDAAIERELARFTEDEREALLRDLTVG